MQCFLIVFLLSLGFFVRSYSENINLGFVGFRSIAQANLYKNTFFNYLTLYFTLNCCPHICIIMILIRSENPAECDIFYSCLNGVGSSTRSVTVFPSTLPPPEDSNCGFLNRMAMYSMYNVGLTTQQPHCNVRPWNSLVFTVKHLVSISPSGVRTGDIYSTVMSQRSLHTLAGQRFMCPSEGVFEKLISSQTFLLYFMDAKIQSFLGLF